MSKLVKFNEMLSSKEELDLMDEIKSRLVFLIDDGLKIDSEKSKYHDIIFTIHTGKQKLWIDLKDYIIPLFIFLDKNYKLNYAIRDSKPYHIALGDAHFVNRPYWSKTNLHKDSLLNDEISDDTRIPVLQFRILNKK